MRTSIDLLDSADPLCKNLLYLLGCLPGGATIAQLKVLWNEPEEHLRKLEDLSLLETCGDKKILIPKIQEYIQKDVHSKSKEEHISYICKFYLATLEEYYQVNSSKVAKITVADKRVPNDTGLEIFKTKLILAVHGN